MTPGERVLRLAGDDPAEAERLGLLRAYLVFHLAFELLITSPWEAFAGTVAYAPPGGFSGFFFALGVALCLVLHALRPARRLAATRLAAAFGAGAVAWLFPGVPNHFFLVVFCLVLLSFVDLRQPAEALLGLQSLRLTAAIVLFYTGVQKLVYGTYFHGEFLTWGIAHTERFAGVFRHLLSAEEWARLRVLPPEGPYGTEWWPLLVASNAVWIFELVMPLFLLWKRTRGPATVATVAFLIFVEAGALEWLFGCVFVSLLLLFPRRDFLPRALPVFLAVYALLFADRIATVFFGQPVLEGWLP